MDLVSSEVHTFAQKADGNDPKVDPTNVVSSFKFTSNVELANTAKTEYDEDGDPILQRRAHELSDAVLTVEHSPNTCLALVGLQVWRGALYLADFILANPQIFQGAVVLELGAGTGLTSIVAAKYAAEVISTDVDRGSILKLIRSNVERNGHISKAPVHVVPLDFFHDEWNRDLTAIISRAQVVLAADVVYHNELTDAFFKTISKILLSKPKKVYVALEKRYVFTVADLDVVAPCYEHFMDHLQTLMSRFVVREINEVPQSFNYERVPELVLWEISSE